MSAQRRVHHTEQEHSMQKSAKPIARLQQSRKQASPVNKNAQPTGPQPLDEQQLRQVAGGLPHNRW
jgi:hypothetical protein